MSLEGRPWVEKRQLAEDLTTQATSFSFLSPQFWQKRMNLPAGVWSQLPPLVLHHHHHLFSVYRGWKSIVRFSWATARDQAEEWHLVSRLVVHVAYAPSWAQVSVFHDQRLPKLSASFPRMFVAQVEGSFRVWNWWTAGGQLLHVGTPCWWNRDVFGRLADWLRYRNIPPNSRTRKMSRTVPRKGEAHRFCCIKELGIQVNSLLV